MALLAGVTFRKVGKLHYYPAENWPLEVGSFVVADSPSGLEFGEVKFLRDVVDDGDGAPEYRIARRATDDDARIAERRRQQAEEGITLCQECADRMRMPMKVVDSEVAAE